MKIFGIGLSKTGTTSLTKMLELLGYRAEHNGACFVTEPPEKMRELDAATDELGTSYPMLDERYPGSKFILTIRDRDSWLKSCSHHFRVPIDESTRVGKMMMDLYDTTVFDAEKFSAGFDRHVAKAKEYFRGREKDFLVIDLVGGEGWEKLCPFLGKPSPDAPIPKENVSRSLGRFTRRIKQVLRGKKKS